MCFLVRNNMVWLYWMCEGWLQPFLSRSWIWLFASSSSGWFRWYYLWFGISCAGSRSLMQCFMSCSCGWVGAMRTFCCTIGFASGSVDLQKSNNHHYCHPGGPCFLLLCCCSCKIWQPLFWLPADKSTCLGDMLHLLVFWLCEMAPFGLYIARTRL